MQFCDTADYKSALGPVTATTAHPHSPEREPSWARTRSDDSDSVPESALVDFRAALSLVPIGQKDFPARAVRAAVFGNRGLDGVGRTGMKYRQMQYVVRETVVSTTYGNPGLRI